MVFAYEGCTLLQSNTNSYQIELQVRSEPACMLVLPFIGVPAQQR